MVLVTALAFFAIAFVNWVAVTQQPEEQPQVEYVAKPAALVMLLLFAATGNNPSWWLIAALGFSLLGDVYLMLPGNLFTAGLGAFLLAHAAYIVGFHASLGWRLLWFVLLGGFAYLLGARQVLAAVEDRALRSAVAVYMAVICFMVASAIASGSLRAAIGALLFLASDTLLAWNRFVQPFSHANVMVMVTYHLGQFLLVSALRS